VEIYDRNYGKDDPNYKFPAEYQPFIVGNLPFDQIDKAYKGYNYAINLNSIKQSQSMFARRVFDLLASNTVTVSNFSRGIRLMFGDLLISTDNGMEALRQLEALVDNEQSTRKLRLAALRKVMREHTYQDRLAYVLSKVRNQDNQSLLPNIVVNSYAKNQQQADSIFNSFQQQSHANKSLVLVVPGGFEPANVPEDERILIIAAPKAQDQNLIDLGSPKDWLAVMVPDDYYGTNYLLDLAIATRYAQAPVIGKATIYVFSTNSGINISNKGEQYRRVSQIPARSGIIKINQAENITLREWVGTLYTKQLEHQDALSIDEFNYCKNAGVDDFHSTQKMIVDDLPRLNSGLALQDIISQAEQIPPEAQDSTATPHLNGNDLAALFYQPPARTQVSISVQGKLLQIDSALEDGKHEYWYSIQDHLPQELGAKDGHLAFYLEVTPGLNIQLTLLFLDAQKQRISHVVKTANRNQEAELPAGTKYVRLGLRVYAAGSARIHALLLGHRKLQPAEILATGEHLLLTNHYPSDNDLYRNGFVHSRVVAYKKQGLKVDVFRLRNGEPLSYHEFGNVDCITGSQEALHQLLTSGHHKSVLVHFLDEDMWDVLKHHIDQTKMVVWVHGAEIQPFHRREYNYNTEEARKTGKIQSEKRMKFWRSLLQSMPSNLQLVFVSQYFAEEVMEDLGFRLPESQYKIIHNPIDTNLFHHETKPAEQRMRILSVRPYASAKYANDLSVEAILKLSKKPWFNELEFRIIGDGILFEETLSPLRKFRNIHIEQRFLSQKEIAQLHKSYGLFLCPTRMDAQGVSRDEAMSSGLVPVTNAVAAIPEFVDRNSGILAPGEDAEAMAEGIERLYHNPELFAAMSKEAARRVRTQTSNELIIKQEFQEIVDIEDS
jgi:glycosyltransferase involved in cell wall biosynthesis